MKKAVCVESPDMSLVTFDLCANDNSCDGVITVVAAGQSIIYPNSLYIVTTIGHHSCTEKVMFNNAIAGIRATDELGGPGIISRFKDGIAFEDQITIDEIHPDIASAFQLLFDKYQLEHLNESKVQFTLSDNDCTWIGGKPNASGN